MVGQGFQRGAEADGIGDGIGGGEGDVGQAEAFQQREGRGQAAEEVRGYAEAAEDGQQLVAGRRQHRRAVEDGHPVAAVDDGAAHVAQEELDAQHQHARGQQHALVGRRGAHQLGDGAVVVLDGEGVVGL